MNDNSVDYKKTVIVLLHGWGMSKETWKHISPSFRNDFSVYAIDLPGFGDNQQVNSNFILKDYVLYLHDFLRRKKIDKVVLVGWSFGSRVAALYSLTYPEKVSKLILYSTSLPSQLLLSDKASIRKSLITHGIILASVLTRSMRNKKISVKDYVELKELHARSRKGEEYARELKRIIQPTLLIAGRFDFVAPLSNHIALQKVIPQAKLVIFNRSTHAAHIEEKHKFIYVLKEFIS